MARFYTFAEVLTPEHVQWDVHTRLPRDEGPVDPARVFDGTSDPANPRRILRTSAGG